MLWYYNRALIDQYDQEIQLIAENQYAMQDFLATYGYGMEQDTQEYKEISEQGIRSTYQLKAWGVYNVLTVISYSKKDSISKSFLLGNTKKKNPKLALFLLDNGKPLKYAGITSLFENIVIPDAHIEAYFIPKKKNLLQRSGNIASSPYKMPKLALNSKRYDLRIKNSIPLEKVIADGGVLVNSFQNETLEVIANTSSTINQVTLKGNIILTSTNEIILGDDTDIQDVVIQAPSVRFLKNFNGNAQVIATDKIILEDNAILKYPSSIHTKIVDDSIKVSLIGKSKLYGSLIMNCNSTIYGRKGEIFIDKESTIIGDLYSCGVTDLRGTIYGSAYINSFQYKTETNSIDNLIVDAYISSDSIPHNYMRLPLIDDTEYIYYEVIKEL